MKKKVAEWEGQRRWRRRRRRERRRRRRSKRRKRKKMWWWQSWRRIGIRRGKIETESPKMKQKLLLSHIFFWNKLPPSLFLALSPRPFFLGPCNNEGSLSLLFSPPPSSSSMSCQDFIWAAEGKGGGRGGGGSWGSGFVFLSLSLYFQGHKLQIEERPPEGGKRVLWFASLLFFPYMSFADPNWCMWTG